MSDVKPDGEALPLSLRRTDGGLLILDQTRAPEQVVEERHASARQAWRSIEALKVRGAPPIGIAGAYGLAVAAEARREAPVGAYLQALHITDRGLIRPEGAAHLRRASQAAG